MVIARGRYPVVSGPRSVERRFVAMFNSSVMLRRIICIGTWPGPSIITCTSYSQAILVSSPSARSSANWASSLAS